MSETTHTPGPWTRDGTPEGLRICAPFDQLGPRGVTVAEVSRAWKDDAEARADANLIAAAPDLLAALSRLVEWIDCGCDPSSKSLDSARAAIAKARGT